MCTDCLLVDDDADDRYLFTTIMNGIKPDCECRYAGDGREALDLLEQNPDFNPRFILLDMNMPRMNGIETLTRLRQLERTRHTPIYMYSTASDTAVVEQCKALGCNDYIVKSTSFGQMVQHVERLVRHMTDAS